MDSLNTRGVRIPLAWLVAGLLFLVLIMLVGLGWWQGTATGPQIQVPMFYDAHYLFPRPWTQSQEAPGVPEPAPLSALYGPNRISQTFVSGMDQLSMIRLWLSGPVGTPVQVWLAGNDHVYSGEIMLADSERYYELAFPPFSNSKGQTFTITLYAPQATLTKPVSTRTVGGDWLGGTFYLNEYPRPGSLELYTYGRGMPGRWWLQAIGQQLLPSVFALRLQQYKPNLFKGAVFPVLLTLIALFSAAYLVLAWPGKMRLVPVVGWGVAGLLLAFLVWQLVDGRARLPLLTAQSTLTLQDELLDRNPGPGEPPWLVHDFITELWTVRREPEARFIHARWAEEWSLGAIQVPALSGLHFSQVIPLNGRFRTGLVAQERPLRFLVRLGEEIIHHEEIPVSGEATWVEVDLAAWGGQLQDLTLSTEPIDDSSEEVVGLWLVPQLSAKADWLLMTLPDQEGFQTAGHYLAPPETAGLIELAGYKVEPGETAEELIIILYWQAHEPIDAYGTVFVHLLDESGQLVAQHDGQPVLGTYPVPAWQPGQIVMDSHRLVYPGPFPAGPFTLAVGLYNPDNLTRWPATDPLGAPLPDNRVLLPVPILD